MSSDYESYGELTSYDELEEDESEYEEEYDLEDIMSETEESDIVELIDSTNEESKKEKSTKGERSFEILRRLEIGGNFSDVVMFSTPWSLEVFEKHRVLVLGVASKVIFWNLDKGEKIAEFRDVRNGYIRDVTKYDANSVVFCTGTGCVSLYEVYPKVKEIRTVLSEADTYNFDRVRRISMKSSIVACAVRVSNVISKIVFISMEWCKVVEAMKSPKATIHRDYKNKIEPSCSRFPRIIVSKTRNCRIYCPYRVGRSELIQIGRVDASSLIGRSFENVEIQRWNVLKYEKLYMGEHNSHISCADTYCQSSNKYEDGMREILIFGGGNNTLYFFDSESEYCIRRCSLPGYPFSICVTSLGKSSRRFMQHLFVSTRSKYGLSFYDLQGSETLVSFQLHNSPNHFTLVENIHVDCEEELEDVMEFVEIKNLSNPQFALVTSDKNTACVKVMQIQDFYDESELDKMWKLDTNTRIEYVRSNLEIIQGFRVVLENLEVPVFFKCLYI